jgi:NAD(P)-dependent dehydrogenase (short-subunit alcohol dehydrogenase family)
MMVEPMKGKVALVTGGSSGIGFAAAQAFINQGARVVIASRRSELGEAAAAQLCSAGGQAEFIQTDVSNVQQVEALFQRTQEKFGRLDYAFNNGGSGGRGGWLEEIAEEDFDLTIDGFLKSVWLCMKAEIKLMLAQGGGTIVNNSSVDGLRAFPDDPIYSAAKHGVLGLTKSGALQCAQRGIRINAVCPGWIRTPPVDEWTKADPGVEGRMLMHQPIGRLGTAEEVANTVVWLCSDQASLITGVSLPVDGGYTVI